MVSERHRIPGFVVPRSNGFWKQKRWGEWRGIAQRVLEEAAGRSEGPSTEERKGEWGGGSGRDGSAGA